MNDVEISVKTSSTDAEIRVQYRGGADIIIRKSLAVVSGSRKVLDAVIDVNIASLPMSVSAARERAAELETCALIGSVLNAEISEPGDFAKADARSLQMVSDALWRAM